MTTQGDRAGLVIIGNEVLSGRTQDANTAFIGAALADHGVALSEVRIVRDVESSIVAAVDALRTAYDFVFTTGGIGPTHDDITTAAVARSFGVVVLRHPEAEARLNAYYGPERISSARLKMADIPEGASLIDNPATVAPGFRLGNVFVLPGIPRIMQAMFGNVLAEIEGGAPIASLAFTVWSPESEIAAEMAAVQAGFPGIDVGSYPFVRGRRFGTTVVVRGREVEALNAAAVSLSAALVARGIDHARAPGPGPAG